MSEQEEAKPLRIISPPHKSKWHPYEHKDIMYEGSSWRIDGLREWEVEALKRSWKIKGEKFRDIEEEWSKSAEKYTD
ncbi:MAG: hypothetical protein QXU72_08695 [Thermofilum sp.]